MLRRMGTHGWDRLKVVTLSLIVVAAACGGTDPQDHEDDDPIVEPPSPGDDTGSVTALVSARDGGVLVLESGPLAGLRLTIPPGALTEDTEITLSAGGESQLGLEVSPGENPAVGMPALEMVLNMVGGWEGLSHYGVMLTLEQLNHGGAMPAGTTLVMSPEGLQFLVPATVEMPYAELLGGDDPVDDASARWLTAVHVSEDAPTELLLPVAFDASAKTISFEVHHFSKVGFSRFFEALGRALLSRGAISIADSQALGQGAYNGVMRVVDTAEGAFEAFVDSEATDLLAMDMAAEILCSRQDLDLSVPEHGLTNLLSALTMISSEQNLISQQTGHELAYLDAMVESDGPVTFDEAFQKALELTNGNVYDAFMTMHNVGQSQSYGTYDTVSAWGGNVEEAWSKLKDELPGKMAPLTGMDERITDTRGGWYHIAGLAAFSMRSGKGLPSVMAAADEVGMSGLLGGHFSVGDQLANMIGSALGDAIKDLAERADELGLCDELQITITSPAEDTVLADAATSVTVHGEVNLASVETITLRYEELVKEVPVVGGTFSTSIDLALIASHTITASASTSSGQEATDEVTVIQEVALVLEPSVNHTGGNSYRTTEGGKAMRLFAKLSRRPADSVVVSVTGIVEEEGRLIYPEDGFFQFTSNDWHEPQTLQIKGVADNTFDLDAQYEVVLAAEEGVHAGLEETVIVVNENIDAYSGWTWCDNTKRAKAAMNYNDPLGGFQFCTLHKENLQSFAYQLFGDSIAKKNQQGEYVCGTDVTLDVYIARDYIPDVQDESYTYQLSSTQGCTHIETGIESNHTEVYTFTRWNGVMPNWWWEEQLQL